MCGLLEFIGGAIVGFGFALVTPFAIRWLTLLILGPRLDVEFDADEVEAKDGQSNKPQCYFRVKVMNSKSLVLRGCRGYLTRIVDLNTKKPLLYETFPLIWSYDPGREWFDLPHGPTPTIDVVRYGLDDPFFLPCLRGANGATLKPNKFDGTLLAKGTYEFTVLVVGEDVAPELRTFSVTYDGQNWPPVGKAT